MANTDIDRNFAEIRALIPEGVTLVAVSKTQAQAALEQALKTGQRVFGENRVQEAQKHWGNLKPGMPDLRLHLIGPLQTNKVREAVALFDVIETLDRPRLVDALAREMKKQDRNIPCFIQVNTGAEEQKSGAAPDDVAALLGYAHSKRITVVGLMCIPPAQEDPAPHFAMLARMAQNLGLSQLSMGMSADFEAAIKHGATHVRVGSRLFGERKTG